ncbi:hypothetical protein MNV49_007387 [Pseudohyphozyma bogoriensis]|nr:hypothetical protein MNV49_007387 [Pseudohyphozyma bogoriensis]
MSADCPTDAEILAHLEQLVPDPSRIISTSPLIVSPERPDTSSLPPEMADIMFPPDTVYFLYLPHGRRDLVVVDTLPNLRKIASWPCWDTPVPAPTTSPSYEIVPVEGKGLGMVATRDIARGELILEEQVVTFTGKTHDVDSYVEAAVSMLSPESKQKVLGLVNSVDGSSVEDAVYDTLNTNQMSVSAYLDRPFSYTLNMTNPVSVLEGSALAPLTSRLNHDCTPNADYHFSANMTMRLVAVRAIAKGDEITDSYVPITSPFATRQEELEELYNFTCRCKTCSLLPATRAVSDRTRAVADEGRIGDDGSIASVKVAKEAIEALKKENISHRSLAWLKAGYYHLEKEKKYAKAVGWAELILSTLKEYEGADSWAVGYWTYRISEIKKRI